MSDRGSVERVGIVAKLTSREAINTAHELCHWLKRRDIRVALDEAAARAGAATEVERYDSGERYDLVVVLGGDGTLLSVARGLVAGVPILGVNLGHLGFLTEIAQTEIYPTLEAILGGTFCTESRAMLEVELHRRGGTTPYRVLNDAVINKSALARIIDLTLSVDGQLVATYRSDGLIVSTPTGSTAYNLSAGGPIVNPCLPVVVITPICPHTFSQRPVALPYESVIKITLGTQNEEVYLTLDGQEGTSMGYRDTVEIRPSEQQVKLVKTGQRTFYDSLREKLHWGE